MRLPRISESDEFDVDCGLTEPFSPVSSSVKRQIEEEEDLVSVPAEFWEQEEDLMCSPAEQEKPRKRTRRSLEQEFKGSEENGEVTDAGTETMISEEQIGDLIDFLSEVLSTPEIEELGMDSTNETQEPFINVDLQVEDQDGVKDSPQQAEGPVLRALRRKVQPPETYICTLGESSEEQVPTVKRSDPRAMSSTVNQIGDKSTITFDTEGWDTAIALTFSKFSPNAAYTRADFPSEKSWMVFLTEFRSSLACLDTVTQKFAELSTVKNAVTYNTTTSRENEVKCFRACVKLFLSMRVEIDNKQNVFSKVISDQSLSYVRSPWLTKFIPSIYTVVFLLSLPLNATAIMIFLFRIHLKKPSVVFMFNLAVADVLFVTLLPFNIVYRFSGNNWVIGEGMCRFVTVAFYCNMYCSILLMTSISVDRFLGVVYPIQSLTWRTVSRAWLVCLLIWVVSIAGTVPLLVNKLTVRIYEMNITTCYDMLDMKDIQRFYLPYFTTYVSAFFLLPFIVTTFCYVMTIRGLSSPKFGNPKKKSRSIVLCVVVLFEYIFCFGPTNVIFFIYYLNFDKPFGNSVYFAYILSVSLSTISCCLDPVVYYHGFSKSKKLEYKLVCCGKTMADFIDSFTPSSTTGRETSSQTL
ncbi:hypothetical protein AB205_0165980 [Aquarana catesbeiana]|uniref:Proteinase-activated receptor 1 n=1 Tax=Aquarana catesbeiana TaxID=8400 RepID=A0A2G9R5I3_AQUCT|nr:hypothetical protein AB205_0165980 [Aquarana catesbeiana]